MKTGGVAGLRACSGPKMAGAGTAIGLVAAGGIQLYVDRPTLFSSRVFEGEKEGRKGMPLNKLSILWPSQTIFRQKTMGRKVVVAVAEEERPSRRG